MDPFDEAVGQAVAHRGVILLLGGLDSGKTTLARRIAADGLEAGATVAVLDADVGQSTVGPPTTVGLRLCRSPSDLEPEALAKADEIAFVGSTSPQGHLLPLAVGARRLLDRARAEGADLVVVDTTGLVTGVYAQVLKFQKIELLQPDLVIGLARGQELDPLIGIVRRFFAADVLALRVHPDVVPASVEQRAQNREQGMQRYFAAPLQRWRVQPTGFFAGRSAPLHPDGLGHNVVG